MAAPWLRHLATLRPATRFAVSATTRNERRSANTGQQSKSKVSKNPSQGFRCSNDLSLPSIANGTELCMWVIRQRPLSRRKHAVARKKSSTFSPSVLVPAFAVVRRRKPQFKGFPATPE